jgi:hypothetical protein
MISIGGREVLANGTLVLGVGENEAAAVTPLSRFVFRFGGQSTRDPSVEATMEGASVVFLIADGGARFPYIYDGMLNEDGAPAYSVHIYVSPMGDGERARFVAYTIARLADGKA